MNGHDLNYEALARTAIPARVGPAERRAIAEDGDFILVREVWPSSAADLPFCILPRGSKPAGPYVQRTVVMYRSEAQAEGLIR